MHDWLHWLLTHSEITWKSLLPFGIGCILIWWGLKNKRKAESIKKTCTTLIRDITKDGLYEVLGKVALIEGRILKSPIGNQECVYCEYNIEQKGFIPARNTYDWKEIKSGINHVSFYINDGSGFLAIYPETADIEIEDYLEIESSQFKKIPSHIKSLLNSLNINTEGLLEDEKQFKFTETIIKPEQKLFVHGNVFRNRDRRKASQGIRYDELMFCGNDKSKLLITDKSEKEIAGDFDLYYKLGLFVGLGFILTSIAYLYTKLR